MIRLFSIAVLVWAMCASGAPLAQDGQQQCLAREQVLELGTLFAELEYSEVNNGTGPLPRRYLYVGDPQTRDFLGYATADAAQVCYVKRHQGFGWYSENVRKRSKQIGLEGIALSSSDDGVCASYNAQNGGNACMASGTMVRGQLQAGRRPVAGAVINRSWSAQGKEIFTQPFIWVFFADKRGETLATMSKPMKGNYAFEVARGSMTSSTEIEGDAAVFAQWKQKRPPLPGDSIMRTVATRTLAANPDALCTKRSEFTAFGEEVFTATNNRGQRYRIFVAPDDTWVLSSELTQGNGRGCYAPLLFGTDFETADYVRDRFQQASAIDLPRFDGAQAAANCNGYKQIHADAANVDLACNTFGNVLRNVRGKDGDVAFHGTVIGTSRPSYLTGLVAKDGTLYGVESDADGVSQIAFSASGFAFSNRFQQLHFADRRAGIAREKAERDRKARLAREERERERKARIAAKIENDRQAAARERVAASPERAAAMRAIDMMILQDSQSWWMNRYNPGTVRNMRAGFVFGGAANRYYEVDYTYNDTSTGSVKVYMAGDDYVYCIKYWDMWGDCRPPRKGPNMTKVALALGALALVAANSSSR